MALSDTEPAVAHQVTTQPSRSADRRALVLVWGCWLAGLVSALTAVLVSARDVPIHEDWNLVAAMTGHQDHFLSWLWAQNNEHRLPLPKLVYLGLLKLWPDFRVGMVFNVVLLAAIAAVFMIVVRRVRGHTRWTDAFFPIAFLNLGNWENMGWGWEMQFVIATALACGVLLFVASRRPFTMPRALGLGVCLVGIPLSGATALPFAPVVAVALVPRLRSGSPRGARIVLSASIVLTLMITVVYFVGLRRQSWLPSNPGVFATAETGAKFLAMAMGAGAGAWWFVSVLVAVAFLAGAALFLYRSKGSETRTLLAFLAGGVALAIEMGYSRAQLVPYYGMPDRYALIAVPAFCCVYVAFDRYGPRTWRRLGPSLLCLSLVALLPLDTIFGLQFRSWYRTLVDSFTNDVRAGVPLSTLSYDADTGPGLNAWTLLYLHQARIGAFKQLRVDHGAPPPPGRRIDGFEEVNGGWYTIGGSTSQAAMEQVNGHTVLRWDYTVSGTGVPLLGRSFPTPQDWRGTEALAITFQGDATGRVIYVRVAAASGRTTVERYEAPFVDSQKGTQTVVIPWDGFGYLNAQGEDELLPQAMPPPRIIALVFGVTGQGSGSLVIDKVALEPGHPELDWPYGSASVRRSLPPWR